MYTIYPDHIYRIADKARIPLDAENKDYAEFLKWQAAGGVEEPPPVPPFKERQAALLVEVDKHLNAVARVKGYDSRNSFYMRAAVPGSPFHAEGVAFATWMDSVYAKCYEVLAQVVAGEIPEPTAAELLAMLPILQLPE